jgi:hypothetical protein
MRLLLVVVRSVNVGDREGEERGDLELELRSSGGKSCSGSVSAGLATPRAADFAAAFAVCLPVAFAASLAVFFAASFATACVPAAAAPTPGIMAIPIGPAMLPTVMAAHATLIAVT